MKKMLIFENKEKEIIRKASALINTYCDEIDDCEECPFNGLCTKIQNNITDLNVPTIFDKVKDLIG